MIALHVGYKANIKAAHDFKGCAEKKGALGTKMAPTRPPVAPFVIAGPGKLEQSKLEANDEQPASQRLVLLKVFFSALVCLISSNFWTR